MSRLRHYVLHFLPLVILVAAFLFLPLLTFAQADTNPNFAQQLVWGLVVAVTGRLVWIGGIILDAGINTFVIDFGYIFLNSGVGVAVDNTWVVIRDFMNLLFIFGLVYIGFKMILGSDNSNTRRWLVNLILAALLINFSLFITKFVVDFSNQISTAIVESAFETKPETVNGVSKNRVKMSNSLMNLMGISSIVGGTPGGKSALRATKDNAWGYIFGTGIFFLITAFVFTAGGILLIIRFVALSLYIVMSPLMFVGWILPPVSSIMSQYWKGFLKRAFFAPIYFLFLYLSFIVLINFQQSIGGLQSGAWSNSLGGDGNAATASQSVIPFFVLVCGFMIASILVAQKLGADGANTAIKYGQMARQKLQRGLTRTAGAGTVGVAASLGRNTIGRIANNRLQDDKFKSYAAKSAVGKALYKTAQYGAGASFDARQVGGVGKSLGLGEGKKGGYEKNLKDKTAAHKKFLKDLDTVDIDSEEGKKQVEDKTKEIRDAAEKAFATETGAKTEFEANLETSSKDFTDSITSLSKTIETIETDLEKKVADGTIRDVDEAAARTDIAAKKQELENKKRAKGSVDKLDSTRIARDAAAKAFVDDDGSDTKKTIALERAANAAEAAYVKQIADEKEAFETAAKAAKATRDTAETSAKSQVKYQHQIEYMNQLERSEKMWGSATSLGASGGGSLLGGYALTAAVPYAGLVGLAGTAAASARSAELKHVREELQREFGRDGSKKMKRDTRIKELREKREAEEDIKGDVDGDGKGDDKK